MARAIPVATGTADAQILTGSGTLLGFSCQESAGTPAAAAFVLRDGTDNTGVPLAFVQLAQGASQAAQLPAVTFTDGLYLDRTDGESEAVVYLL
ncbi:MULTISPECIES: hypothetical protein [unclassified Streptomyces]|uniref:hypothetical protein n=1 Tax=unclassified Streptomyces TaxID=2593676 RepID=UPI000FFEBCFD|nr:MULTISPECIES: hypothetical protein [unclassified Streptomyces]